MRVVPAADPLADLARLRRPTGPWLHLLDGAPSDARQLGWMLGQDGVVVRILRGHCVRSRYGLFDETAAALQLPGDPVEDWPALAGLLTDMSWLPGAGHVLVVSRAALLLAAEPLSELDGLVAAVREVARGRAEEGEPVPFHVVLQDDTLGLAGLRARLDAVGARYDDLAGWDAEEPVAETAVGGRTSYQAGDLRPDELDRAVGAALSTRDGVLAVRRCWEVFSGPDIAQVRVYAPVLVDFVAAVEVVSAVAAVAAGQGAGCLTVPLLAEPQRRDPRQQAVAAASVEVWPVPEPVPEPPPPRAPVAAESLPGSTADLTPSTVETPAEPAVLPPAPGPEPAPGDDPAGPFELVAANLEWSFATGTIAPDRVDDALIRYASGATRLAGLFRSWVADPAGGWVRVVMAYVGSGSISGVETERSTIVDVVQRSNAKRCCIEIVGLSDVGDVHRWLEERSVTLWPPTPADPPAGAGTDTAPASRPAAGPSAGTDTDRAPGPAAADRTTDEAADDRTAGQGTDPAPGRAAAGQTTPASSADQRPATAPAASAPAASAASPESDTQASGAPPPGSPAAGAPSDGPDQASEHPVAPAPAGAGQAVSGAGPLPAGAELPVDAGFQPGPGEDEPALAALVSWAGEQAGVLGLVTAWTEVAGARTVVVGVVVDGEVDQAAVRAAVAAQLEGLPGPFLVESFAPSGGLSPLHLRLYRASTRLWTRKVERAPTNRPGVLQLDTTYHSVDGSIDQVLDLSESIDDERFDSGFTLVGLDLNASVQRGAEEPDERDGAVVGWIREQPHALALLRAMVDVPDGTPFPVYCVLVDADADRPALRHGAARVVAGTGVEQAGVEVFCPFERIAVFHVQLYGASLSLWKTDRPPPAPTDEPAADGSTAGESTSDGAVTGPGES